MGAASLFLSFGRVGVPGVALQPSTTVIALGGDRWKFAGPSPLILSQRLVGWLATTDVREQHIPKYIQSASERWEALVGAECGENLFLQAVPQRRGGGDPLYGPEVLTPP